MASSSSCACSSTSSKKFVLKTSDKELYYVDENVALQSLTIKHMIAEIGDIQGQIIPLPNVTGKTLGKVIEYCKNYEAERTDRDADDDPIKVWEEKFLDELDQDTFFDLMLAANYMDIKSLLMVTCKYVARTIQGNSPEEIRKIYNIKNDYTPEQEEAIRRENPWAFDAIKGRR
ncbi:SKP1-like protein 12 [Chenopodium quinoa]|uniref:SKP1-like protein n=1 Tax=Chenopodium quinoa TaxID=63459 RepID=A0A803LIV2_CHEQI|nr:SKP1-like protein 12 [Chenopodium quinoa]